MRSQSTTRFCACIVLAAYLFLLFGAPTISYADEKSAKAKSDAKRWHPRNRDSGLDGETKALLVTAGVLVAIGVVALIVKAVGKHGDGKEREEKTLSQPDEQARIDDASQVFVHTSQAAQKKNKNHCHVCFKEIR